MKKLQLVEAEMTNNNVELCLNEANLLIKDTKRGANWMLMNTESVSLFKIHLWQTRLFVDGDLWELGCWEASKAKLNDWLK